MNDRSQEFRFEVSKEVFRSGVSYAAGGLKMLALINGAAAIALLSFLGTASQKAQTPDPTSVKLALWAFMFGTVAAVLAALTAFLAQDRVGRLSGHKPPLDDLGVRLYRWGVFAVAGASLIAFVLGGYWAAGVISP